MENDTGRRTSMSAAWDDRFGTWAQPPSTTESDKIQHAITAVRKAMDADTKLAPLTKVFVQGSYRNRVNVRQDSDVDIGVLYSGNIFFYQCPPGKTAADFGIVDAPYPYGEFKNDVQAALTRHFGADKVTRGPKAFDIHENTYRVDADVVPLMTHRRYGIDGSYLCGTELRADDGTQIINWPERLYDSPIWPNQHYENGNAKNTDTARSYRGAVRIIKKLRNVMDEAGVAAAKPIKGFFVECLVWNVPNSCFAQTTWYEVVSEVLEHLWLRVTDVNLCGGWTEVSGYKWLLKNDEEKRIQAATFVAAARKYIGA
jgi:hypothetical protein